MRLARVRTADGSVWLARLGPTAAELVHRESDHPAADALREALAAGTDLRRSTVGTVPIDAVDLLAPVANPSKFLGVGLNYATHAAESGEDIPQSPLLFAKGGNSIAGPDDVISIYSDTTTQPDFEVELAVVIGRIARRIRDDPLAYVLGYTVCNDLAARDVQFREGQWCRAKSFNRFGPLGPWITTRDEVGSGRGLRLTSRLNGELMQDGRTDDMIFDVPALIRFIAESIDLQAGDVVTTGTPPGVGFARTPPVYLADGDTVECAIEKIGALRNLVRVLHESRGDGARGENVNP